MYFKTHFAVQKIKDSGNDKVWLTERGNTFGYQDLVVDYRNIPAMQKYAPVVLDITHSLQQPNQTSGVTGGDPSLIEAIALSAISTGADGFFIETHPEPEKALCDAASQLCVYDFEEFMKPILELHATEVKWR